MALNTKDTPFEPKASGAQTLVARDSRVTGEITGNRPVRIEGSLSGSVSLSAAVEIAEGAVVEAEVKATTVRVAGQVVGAITATELVELLATAVVKGDLTAPALHVVAGARLDGTVRMVVETPPAAAPRKS